MQFIGIDSVIYGAPDVPLATKLFTDWGLRKVGRSRNQVALATEVGSRVVIARETSASLPSRLEGGSNFREVIWGVAAARDIDEIERELSRDRTVHRDRDGTIHTVDDSGINIGFRVWKHGREAKVPGTPFNTPGSRRRVDRIAKVYERAQPYRMGHIVFFVPDTARAERFYRKRLGFWLSDRYVGGAGVFLRWAKESDHHNLFFVKSRDGKTDINHVAFEVHDLHEVFGGGVHFGEAVWETAVGPGRHPISSAYFWYFKNPLGGTIEYFSDPDYVTEKWKPHNYRVNRFSEWHLNDGIQRKDDGVVRPSLAALKAM
ncbi:MAG: VOC family protein [Burkholderiales bacterium]